MVLYELRKVLTKAFLQVEHQNCSQKLGGEGPGTGS